MKLKSSGTVKINGYNCIFTQDGQWAISRHGVPIGFVDTLAEVSTFTERNLEKIRVRLRRYQEQAAEE
jgi:hypothetical protein